MAQLQYANQSISGQVDHVRGNAFTLRGVDGWFPLSRFAANLQAPSEGDDISVTVDKSGFVRQITGTSEPVQLRGLAPVTPRYESPPDRRDDILIQTLFKVAGSAFAGFTDAEERVSKAVPRWFREARQLLDQLQPQPPQSVALTADDVFEPEEAA